MAELRAGGLAIIIGLKINVNLNGSDFFFQFHDQSLAHDGISVCPWSLAEKFSVCRLFETLRGALEAACLFW